MYDDSIDFNTDDRRINHTHDNEKDEIDCLISTDLKISMWDSLMSSFSTDSSSIDSSSTCRSMC